MTLILAFIGFIALTLVCCFYLRHCCTLAGAAWLYLELGLYTTLKPQELFVVVFGILMLIMGYLDWKNLRLNPFKK